MKRLSFLFFIFSVSLVNFQSQLCAMYFSGSWSSLSDQEKINKNQYVLQCIKTYERYMRIDFFEKQFINKDLLKKLDEIQGLDLQALYLRNGQILASSDRDSLLKKLDYKIKKKYKAIDKLWQNHEKFLMQLLSYDELCRFQAFSLGCQTWATAPDINRQIFAQLDPRKIAKTQVEFQILRTLHDFSQDDQLWMRYNVSVHAVQNKKHHSDVWRFIQHPKQLILGIIFNFAKQGCPAAQEFVRNYHFDFVLFPEQEFDAPVTSEPALSATSTSVARQEKKLNPDAPVFIPSFLVMSGVEQIAAAPNVTPKKESEKEAERLPVPPEQQERLGLDTQEKYKHEPTRSSGQDVPEIGVCREVYKKYQASCEINKEFLELCYSLGRHEQLLGLIKKTGNEKLFLWYRSILLICHKSHSDIKLIQEGIDLLEPLFSLSTGLKNLNKSDLVGLGDLIRVLTNNIENRKVQAFLIRLNLALNLRPKKRFIQNFLRGASSIRDASVQSLVAYIHDQGLNGNVDLMQAVSYWIQALENPLLPEHIKKEVIYFLQQKGQILFDINFQTKSHSQDSYPKNDRHTLDLISACYALVPVLLSYDSINAACMFIAAENTIAFLCEKQPHHDLVNLPAGIKAKNAFHEFVARTKKLDALAALIFSYSRRYVCELISEQLNVNLVELSRSFLESVQQYFKVGDFSNSKRSLLVGLACNMYSILGCRPEISIGRKLLIDLMQGVVHSCPEQFWFFRYNLESLIAGSQDESIEMLKKFRLQVQNASTNQLLGAMIIKNLKKEASWFSWCSIL